MIRKKVAGVVPTTFVQEKKPIKLQHYVATPARIVLCLFLGRCPIIGDILVCQPCCGEAVYVTADCIHNIKTAVTKKFVSFLDYGFYTEVYTCAFPFRIVKPFITSSTFPLSSPATTFVWILLRSAHFPRGIVPVFDVGCGCGIVWVLAWSATSFGRIVCHVCVSVWLYKDN